VRTLIVGAASTGRIALSHTFEQRGYQVATIRLEDAEQRIQRDAPDLVVIDLSEDAPSGLNLLRALAAAPAHPFLLVFAPLSLLEEAVEAGADDFLREAAPPQVTEAHLTLAERRMEQAQEYRRSSEAVKAGHANLLALIENTDDFVLFSDRNGSPVFFNSAYAKVMKAVLNLDMKPGVKPHELLDDADAREMWEGFHRRVLAGERFTTQLTQPHPDGGELCIEVRYNPVMRDGEIIGFSEFSRDITGKKLAERQLKEAQSQLEAKVFERTTELARSNLALQEEINERQRAEEALRASEERYRTVFDTAPLAFVLWDGQGRVVDWNRHAEQLFGYTREEMLGRRFVDQIVPESERSHSEKNMRLVLEGQATVRTTDENITKSGRRIMCAWSRARLFDETGAVAGVISLGLDVTEQRKMEERLRRSEKMEAIGQLAGGIAHDFNNQLVGVMGYADMLKRSLVDERQATYASNILKAARRSAELIAQLLAFARKGKYLSTPVELHSVIAEVIALLERSVDKRITIHRRLDAPFSTTLGDPTQIQNALLNLGLNARDAMPEGGTLTFQTDIERVGEVRVHEHGEVSPGLYVRVRVRDTGIGMERSTVDRIFEPFFTTKKTGTGMGLAAVYGTVRSHRGLIQVDTSPGAGTTFEVMFPLHADVEDEHAESYRYHQPSEVAHVLVVDDEEMVCELAADMIRALGHRVTTSCDGADAVRRYTEMWRDVDIVIFDLVMPRMGGRELFEKLREINPQVKAVLSSGYAIDERAQEILDGGSRGFLQKPYELSTLAATIRELMSE
jgi:PAS domain S-box-containing protein